MYSVYEMLEAVLVEYFEHSQANDTSADTRPMILGLPADSAEGLFTQLTNRGQSDWNTGTGGVASIPVVLVELGGSRNEQTPDIRSVRAGWDYAITVRNSASSFVCIVSPEAGLAEQHSMTSATESIDFGVGPDGELDLQRYPWSGILQRIEREVGLLQPSGDILRLIIRNDWSVSNEASPSQKVERTWHLLDSWLKTSRTDVPSLFRVSGLPAPNSDELSIDAFEVAIEIIHRLSSLCSKMDSYEGLKAELEQGLPNVSDDRREEVRTALDECIGAFSEGFYSLTVGDFAAEPTIAYSEAASIGTWWRVLDAQIWLLLLGERATEQVRVSLEVTNRIDEATSSSFPAVVVAETILGIQSHGADHVSEDLARYSGRRLDDKISPLNGEAIDEIPSHGQPCDYRYAVSFIEPGNTTRKLAKQKTLSLATFRPGLLVFAGDEASYEFADSFQAIEFSGAGFQDVTVFARPDVKVVHLQVFSGLDEASEFDDAAAMETIEPKVVSGSKVLFKGVLIDEDCRLQLIGQCEAGQELARTIIEVRVAPSDFAQTSASSLTTALIAAHRDNKKRPKNPKCGPASDVLGKIEAEYLRNDHSYRPVLACWQSEGELLLPVHIDWATPRLGSLLPGTYQPNSFDAPTAFTSARSNLRQKLSEAGRPLRQTNFCEPEIRDAIDAQLRAYSEWLDSDQESASWCDLVACYDTNSPTARDSATSKPDPSVVLLGPLHPLRLAWHVRAQALLLEGQDRDICPLAGYLDPHAIPGSLTLVLAAGEGGPKETKTFVNVGSADPFWSVLRSQDHLEGETEGKLEGVLNSLRVLQVNLSGGFDSGLIDQAMRELNVVSPTRSLFRIGLKGDRLSSSRCAEELLKWCIANGKNRRRFEIFDERIDPVAPSNEILAHLSGENPGTVLWFDASDDRQRSQYLDLLIIDELGTQEPRAVADEPFGSPFGPKGMFRSKTRSDLGGGRIVQVAVSASVEDEQQSTDLLGKLVHRLESPSFKNGCAHLRLSPLLEPVVKRLGDADFVAVTSNQIDPACFVHGIGASRGMLWDYELPSLSGFGPATTGYYLLARPRDSMVRALTSAIQVLLQDEQQAASITDEIESEISVRGMPILRRLGRGGSQARGELGVLLALRALQGKVNDYEKRSCLPLLDGNQVNLLVAVDPYWETFERVRKSLDSGSSFERPDILVFSIEVGDAVMPTRILITPLEVKFRSKPMTSIELEKALNQAGNLGRLLSKLWTDSSPTELWRLAGLNLLSLCVEHGFRVSSNPCAHGLTSPEWSLMQSRVISDIIHGRAEISIAQEGRLIAFDQTEESKVSALRQSGEKDTLRISRTDALRLLHDEYSSTIQEMVHSLGMRLTSKSTVSEVHSSPDLAGNPQENFDPNGQHDIPGKMDPNAPNGSSESAGAEHTPDESAAEETTTDNDRGENEGVQPEDSSANAKVAEAGVANWDSQEIGKPSSMEAAKNSVTRITLADRERVNSAFSGFVGNEQAVSTLKRDLLSAYLNSPPHLSLSYLLTGPPSTGKTELSRRIASALDLPFLHLDGKAVGTRDNLFENVNKTLEQEGLQPIDVGEAAGRPVREYPPFVALIDEVHLVSKSTQEGLLTLLEPKDRKVVLINEVARVPFATFIFATTRSSDVDSALKTRCTLIPLSPYSKAEVAEMLYRTAMEKEMFQDGDLDDDLFIRIAGIGKCIPRVALQVLEALHREMLVSEFTSLSLHKHLDAVRDSRRVDELGVGQLDLDLLNLLEREGKPVSETAVLGMMPTADKGTVLDEIEPFLRSLGFIELTGRGRALTAKGKTYLLDKRMAS